MAARSKKYVYFFGGGKAEGNTTMKAILGGKGANLAEMTNMGIPVPPGFTISAEVCSELPQHGSAWPPGLAEEIDANLKKLEQLMGLRFGDPEDPLLVSVRSGAAVSMPGMMDTVLNLGLNEDAVKGLIKKSDNERFAWDAYRRFVNMFGDVVMGMEHAHFEEILSSHKEKAGVELDTELSGEQLKAVVQDYLRLYEKDTGEPFPTDPKEQLTKSINAVFKSWGNPRAVRYRQINKITGLVGTAVNVQVMVFGNLGEHSATGVAFTRDPATGENLYYGEYLVNAQGEDVVAGIRTPRPMADLEREMPEIYQQLEDVRHHLEQHYKDIQDLEFTVQENILYILQTRTGKRTAQAALKIATDMVKEGLIDKKEAVLRMDPAQLDQLLHPMFDPQAPKEVVAKGLPASPGAATGRIVFNAEDAEVWASRGERVILARTETSPEDIGGMDAAQGILTSRGGMTSHAAVVARGMGKCCVAGCGACVIDYEAGKAAIGGREVKEGDYVSLDGSTGEVMLGEVPTVEPTISGEFAELMGWADEFRRLGVRANADTPEDAENAIRFEAEGIGLTRTEHMFFGEGRIEHVRQMILAAPDVRLLRRRIAGLEADLDRASGERAEALQKEIAELKEQLAEPLALYQGALDTIEPMQRGDFEGIFRVMAGKPVTIRLIDPPLHEFLPQEEPSQRQMAEQMGIPFEEVRDKVSQMHELNPMLGHRGCRLGITYPEITQMQVRAIIEAAVNVKKEGLDVHPEIMIPLIGTAEEFNVQRAEVDAIAKELFEENGVEVDYLTGTMIEIPRAALTADKVAEGAEFFSFGTNDLTQMTFGYSRDDVGTFVPEYVERQILKDDPFQILDQEGVGELVELGIERGRKTRPDLKVGICGEHGGEPTSVGFCHRVGMDYVSCSPFRVPIARLAAAHAALADEKEEKNS